MNGHLSTRGGVALDRLLAPLGQRADRRGRGGRAASRRSGRSNGASSQSRPSGGRSRRRLGAPGPRRAGGAAASSSLENACTAGFDLHLRVRRRPGRVHVPLASARARPCSRTGLAIAVPPARASDADAVPGALVGRDARSSAAARLRLAASGASTPLVTAPSGIGRSTLILAELAARRPRDRRQPRRRRRADVWGLVEPLRVEGRRRAADAARPPRERRCRAALAALDARTRRRRSSEAAGESPSLEPCSPELATRARSSRAPTWPASCAGTGRSRRRSPPAPRVGPAHPPTETSRRAFAAQSALLLARARHDASGVASPSSSSTYEVAA